MRKEIKGFENDEGGRGNLWRKTVGTTYAACGLNPDKSTSKVEKDSEEALDQPERHDNWPAPEGSASEVCA